MSQGKGKKGGSPEGKKGKKGKKGKNTAAANVRLEKRTSESTAALHCRGQAVLCGGTHHHALRRVVVFSPRPL